ncbi:MAG: TIGR03619 family F420-dependent LLM class oxidoreductase [Actinomycetota bacterium]
MDFGVALGRLNPAFYLDVTREAEQLGFESVWLPEHLVLPRQMSRSPHPGQSHPPVPPETPVFDAFTYLGFLAGATERIRLATHVYNIGLRHPFIAARAVQTLDIVSGGRAVFGIGASWLEEEWTATQLDFSTRGRRVDECITVCKRLWTEPEVTHHGECFSFESVVFEAKPVQRPWPPILVGGESRAALRRAAAHGDGWVGISHTVESVAAHVATLRGLLAERGRAVDGFEVVVGGPVESPVDADRWAEAGVTRLIVAPWRRSKEAVAGLRDFAQRMELLG